MTDKKPHIVKLKGKGTDGTGVTEDLARQMCTHKGRRYMAVVEVMVDVIHDSSSGQKTADLSIEQFWPAVDTNLDDHLRELTRTLHQNKALADEHDTPIDNLDVDGPTPDLATVLAQGAHHRPHDYQPADDDTDIDQCEVCGDPEDTPVHADRGALADPFTAGEEPDDTDEPVTDQDLPGMWETADYSGGNDAPVPA
ncbi:hypothetical protein [Microcystis phage MinS1]|nr:hypothetical protein [Microcystis phage MinS1]